MNASTYLEAPPRRKLMGLAAVVALHALLFAALHAGLDRTVLQNMPTVVQALLLEDPRSEPTLKPATPPRSVPPPPSPSPSKPPTSAAPVVEPPVTPPAIPLPMPLPPTAAPNAIAVPNSAAVPNTSANTASAAPAPTAPAPAQAATRVAPPVRTTANVNMAQCDKPEYPSASRRMEEEGTVSLRFLVGIDGKIIQSEVEKSSGYKRLDEAARAGLSKCQFKPATVDGKPEQAWTTLRYVWRLD